MLRVISLETGSSWSLSWAQISDGCWSICFPADFRAPLSRMCWSGIKVRIGGLVRGQAVRGSLRVQVCTHVCVLMTADGMILREPELERDYCWLTGELSRLHSIKCVWQSWGCVCSLRSDDERRFWRVWEDPHSDSHFSANTYLSSSVTWANLTLLPTHTHTLSRLNGFLAMHPVESHNYVPERELGALTKQQCKQQQIKTETTQPLSTRCLAEYCGVWAWLFYGPPPPNKATKAPLIGQTFIFTTTCQCYLKLKCFTSAASINLY